MSFKENDVVSCFCKEKKKQCKARILKMKDEGRLAYIHFSDLDKRFDDWFDVSQFSVYIPNPEDDERNKITVTTRKSQNKLNLESEEIHRQVTKFRNIDSITLGNNSIRAWYFSPYPDPYHDMSHLYICEKCFQYFSTKEELDDHINRTKEKTPLGREVYREGNLSIFELFGTKQKISCQNLCLLGKLFLDHKELFYDVEFFSFYVLCETDENEAHIAAYYSRELDSEFDNVLSCIVCLPPYQQKGYGRFLMSAAYEMARRNRKPGGPERPLSDMGELAFKSYWKDVIVETLELNHELIKNVEDLSYATGIAKNDVIEAIKMLKLMDIENEEDFELDYSETKVHNLYLLIKKRKSIFRPDFFIWLPCDEPKA